MPHFWCEPIVEAVRRCPQAVCFVVFPQYRPDLIQSLAAELGFVHWDFRHRVLGPLGWSAGQASLSLLDETIMHADDGMPGAVLANVEALLSAKTVGERRDWLAWALRLRAPRCVVVPLVLYGPLLPEGANQQVLLLSEEDLPSATTMQ